jgi:type I restriction enzyme S subunit
MNTLGKAAEFISGGTPAKDRPEYWNGDIPWFSASNMGQRFLSDTEPKITKLGLQDGSRMAPKGATLLLVRGSGLFNYIPICFVDQPVAFNQDVKAICPKQHVDPTFLHFWIENLRSKLNENIEVTGIGAGKFDLDFLKALHFPDICKEQQEFLRRFASSFDRRIDLNRRMNETLEAMARAIFRDWFVDFGPTRAKMEGRAPYLGPEIWSLFPDKLDDEGKPVGWRYDGLLQHAKLLSGGTPRTEVAEYWNGPIAWASAKDVSQCGEAFLVTSERSITARGLEESSTRLIPKFATVVVARGATTGRFCMFGREIAMNQTCYALHSTERRPFWLNCVFHSLVGELVHGAHGSVFDTITTRTIENARLVLPPLDDLTRCFEVTVVALFERALSNIEESRTLAAMRDLLLPKLMSGEIRLKDAEKALAEVA